MECLLKFDVVQVGVALRDPFLRGAAQTEAQDFVVGFTRRMQDNMNEVALRSFFLLLFFALQPSRK